MADDLALPLYPEVEARKHLSKKQKALVVLRQNGRCAGCGIKPRAWEFDHDKALWKGETVQADLDTWVAYGSRRECNCHRDKTAVEAAERAEMNRLRKATERHARQMRMKITMTPAAIRREKLREQIAAGNKVIRSRNTFDRPSPLFKLVRSESPSKWGRAGGKKSWPKGRKFMGSIRLKKGQA